MSSSDAVKKVRSVIEGLDRDGDSKVFPDIPNAPPFRTASIPAAEGEALRDWIIREKAITAIEIGLAYGFSALHIAEGLLQNNAAEARHTIIDAFQTQPDKYSKVGLNVLAKAGLDRIIEFHNEKSQVVLPRLLGEHKQFDFGFIDGCHLFDYVFLDLFYLGRLVKTGGLIILDDYNNAAIRKAASFFVKNLDWNIEETGSCGEREWLVLRTSEQPDTRHFTYFIDF